MLQTLLELITEFMQNKEQLNENKNKISIRNKD